MLTFLLVLVCAVLTHVFMGMTDMPQSQKKYTGLIVGASWGVLFLLDGAAHNALYLAMTGTAIAMPKIIGSWRNTVTAMVTQMILLLIAVWDAWEMGVEPYGLSILALILTVEVAVIIVKFKEFESLYEKGLVLLKGMDDQKAA